VYRKLHKGFSLCYNQTMKRETSKEVGKGFIAFGNLIGGLSIVNGLFGANHNLPAVVTIGVVIYSVLMLYATGIRLIDKGAD